MTSKLQIFKYVSIALINLSILQNLIIDNATIRLNINGIYIALYAISILSIIAITSLWKKLKIYYVPLFYIIPSLFYIWNEYSRLEYYDGAKNYFISRTIRTILTLLVVLTIINYVPKTSKNIN